MLRFRLLAIACLLSAATLGACTPYEYTGSLGIAPAVNVLTQPGQLLASMPPADRPLNVAVYEFQDLTGQNRSSLKAGFPEFSRAITQGASLILVDALKTAGGGSWFKVVERGNLDSLLRERKLIQDTYGFLRKSPTQLIEPLKFAEYIVTGGVVSYDSPISTANASVAFGNYGGGFTTNRDLVTINIRLVRVRDGEVLQSINASRPILNVSGGANTTRILGRSILDAQAGVGVQEATQTAVREAIELGVYELARRGNYAGLWTWRPPVPVEPAVVSVTGSVKGASAPMVPTAEAPRATASRAAGLSSR